MKIFLILSLTLLASCNLSKKLSKAESKNTEVNLSDSAQITTSVSKIKNDSTYFRETIVFNRPDTSVNNYYTYPSTIIRESGVKQIQQDNKELTETWLRLLDVKNQTDKSKNVATEVQIISPLHLLIAVSALCAIVIIALFILIKFKL